jgi:hypothetical protein
MSPTPTPLTATPLVTPIALHAGRLPASDAQKEALNPETLHLPGRTIIVLNAIASLLSDETPTTTMRDVATQCKMNVGGALWDHMIRLRDLQLVTWRGNEARTVRLTDAGWNRLGLMSPTQQTWREGFLAGLTVQAGIDASSIPTIDATTN